MWGAENIYDASLNKKRRVIPCGDMVNKASIKNKV
jgi:hypothetical protein